MRSATLVLIASACLISVASPSQAESADDHGVMFTESSTQTVKSAEIAEATSPGDEPATRAEEAAVDAYLDALPAESSELRADDLDVATLDFQDDIKAVVVSPDSGATVEAVKLTVDADTNQVSAGAQSRTEGPQTSTAGPGMGTWPRWEDSPSWAIQLRLYRDGNYMGKADFQTQRRKYTNDGNSNHDLWQVARYARAQPDEDDGPLDGRIQKLWVSSKLQDASVGQQWRQDLTNPDAGFQNCKSNSSFTVGPFSFATSDCDEYDVWQGDPGHLRFDYDQGATVGRGTRAIAYVAGFQVDNGASVKGTWYEFVTIEFPLNAYSSRDYKCAQYGAGEQNGTQVEDCRWTS